MSTISLRERQPVVEEGLIGRQPAFQMIGIGLLVVVVTPSGLEGSWLRPGHRATAVFGVMSRTSEGNERPPPYHHQCSAVWDETPKRSPRARVAAASSPTTSRCGPIRAAFHGVDIGVVHGEAVAVLGDRNNVARAGLDKEIDPRIGIEVLRAEQGDEVLVAKLVCGP